MIKHFLLVSAFCILGGILGATGGHADDELGEGGMGPEGSCPRLLNLYLNGDGYTAPCREDIYGSILSGDECSSDIKQQAQEARSICLGQRATEPSQEPTIATSPVGVQEPKTPTSEPGITIPVPNAGVVE